MNKYNITIEEKNKKLEFVVVREVGRLYYACPMELNDEEDTLLLDNIATAFADTFGCDIMWRETIDKYIVRYKNEKGIINATCAVGISFVEVAEKYKDYDVINIEKVGEMQY